MLWLLLDHGSARQGDVKVSEQSQLFAFKATSWSCPQQLMRANQVATTPRCDTADLTKANPYDRD